MPRSSAALAAPMRSVADCPTGKQGFANTRAARRALHSCMRRAQRSRRRREQAFYRCEFCHEFHLTSEAQNGVTRFT